MSSAILGGAAVGQFVQPVALDADYRQLEARLSPFRATAAFSAVEIRCEPRRTYRSLLALATAQPSFLILDPLLDPDSSSTSTCSAWSTSRTGSEDHQQKQTSRSTSASKSECGSPEQQTRFVRAYLASPPVARRSPPPLAPDTDPRIRYGLDVRTSASAETLYGAYVRAQERATRCSLCEEPRRPQVTGTGASASTCAIASAECALNLRPPSLPAAAPLPTSHAGLENADEQLLFLPMPLANMGIARTDASERSVGQNEPSALPSEMLSLALHTPRVTASSNALYAKYSMPPLVNAHASSSGSSATINNSWFFDIRPSKSAMQLYKSYACSFAVPVL